MFIIAPDIVKRLCCTFLLTLCFTVVCGQPLSDEFYRANPSDDEFLEIVTDTSLFYVPLGGGELSLAETIRRYGLRFVTYRYRGIPYRFSENYLCNTELPRALNGYPDYALLSSLWASSVPRSDVPTRMSVAKEPFAGALAEHYDIRASSRYPGHLLRVGYAQARYRFGISVGGSGYMGEKGAWFATVTRRWGRDAFVSGVFTDAVMCSAGASVSATSDCRLSFFVAAAPSLVGLRSWTTREAYDLAGDHLYNPAWGFYGGKVRNARVRRDFMPLAAIVCDFSVSDKSRSTFSVVGYGGEKSTSGMTWYDAPNPMPDYYRSLPSYFSDPDKADAIRALWRSEGENCSQIDWGRMWRANRFASDGKAAYVADERVECVRGLRAALSCVTETNRNVTLEYGMKLYLDQSNLFKRVKDLLGAECVVDIDPYAMDGEDDRSDIRHSYRQAGEEDRFGYDFDIRSFSFGIYGSAVWLDGPFGAVCAAELRESSLCRFGNYEKGTDPGKASYGPSERFPFTNYRFNIGAHYLFSNRLTMSASLFAMTVEPLYGDVFIAPLYANHTIDGVRQQSVVGGEVAFRGLLSGVEVGLTGYCNHYARGTELYRYYDDLYGCYATAALTGISDLHAGVEMEVRLRLSPRLNLSTLFAWNRYRYLSDPQMTIYSESGKKVLLANGTSTLRGLVSSPSPQLFAGVEADYMSASGWGFDFQCLWASQRHVTMNPLRRSTRTAVLAGSPEMLAAFRHQERLPDAVIVNLYVTKRFRIFGYDLFAGVAVNNLLNRDDMIYGGYEQMRIYLKDSGCVPADSRLGYAYPRNMSLNLFYRF